MDSFTVSPESRSEVIAEARADTALIERAEAEVVAEAQAQHEAAVAERVRELDAG